MTAHHQNLMLALALAAGVLGQIVARGLRVPAIMVLLALGAALGHPGLGWVEPEALGAGLFSIVDFGVAVILFEGGLNLEWSRLRREEKVLRRLITVGALATLGGATLCVRALLGWPWSHAVLFGSLVVVTGPTVVTPLLRELRLRARLRTLLEAEGVLIDPIGAFLAALVVQVVIEPGDATLTGEIGMVVLRLVFGTAAGAAAGWLIAAVLRTRWFAVGGLENAVALSVVVLCFHASDAVLAQSGLLAVTVAGVIVGNLAAPLDRDLREFKDQLTVLFVGLLFILLAAGLDVGQLFGLGWTGLAVVALLVVLVRPLAVLIATAGSTLSARERIFVAWIAPRGIVAAAIASLTAVAMEEQGLPGAAELRALVFLTIGTTVTLAGLTARPLASLLALRLPSRDRVAILGAQGLGLALGKELAAGGVPVVFLDSDPRRCSAAQAAGFSVVHGDALAERTLLRAQFELVGTAVGATFNDHLNGLFVASARASFRVPRCLVSVDSLPAGRLPEQLERAGAEVLFDGPHDQERWDVRLRHGQTSVERFAWRGVPEAAPTDAGAPDQPEGAPADGRDAFVVLAVQRDGRVAPMATGHVARDGDQAAVLLHEPERAAAVAGLARLGWAPADAAAEAATESAPAPTA